MTKNNYLLELRIWSVVMQNYTGSVGESLKHYFFFQDEEIVY